MSDLAPTHVAVTPELPSPEVETDTTGVIGVIGPDGTRWSLRMKDLCDATGLMRQAIHFYIKEGLIPPGEKSSRNMAWYGETHLTRLKLVKRLQHERFLPLRAIKAILSEQDDHFSADQQAFIRDVKRHATHSLRGADTVETVSLATLLERFPVTEAEALELDQMGLAPIVEVNGHRVVASEDAWIFETLGQLRQLGFTPEAGFAVADLALYEEAITTLFDREKELLASRLTRFSAPLAAAMVERVLPIAHTFLQRYHEAKIRRFFSAWE